MKSTVLTKLVTTTGAHVLILSVSKQNAHSHNVDEKDTFKRKSGGRVKNSTLLVPSTLLQPPAIATT